MRKVSTKTVVYSVAMLGGLAFLGYTLQDTGNAPVRLSKSAPVAAAASGTTAASLAAGSDRPVQVAPENADMKRYDSIISRGIFSAPKPAEDKNAKVVVKNPTPRPTPIIIAPSHPGPPVIPDPAQPTGWVYAGYYTLNGKTTGVIQNDSADSIRDLAVGEEFLGWKVQSVASDAMVLASPSGRTTRLEHVADFSVVPLEGLTAQPARPTPGRPGMRGGG